MKRLFGVVLLMLGSIFALPFSPHLAHGQSADFSLSTNPTSVTVPWGAIVALTIVLTSLNGFSGIVVLSSSAPTILRASLSPSQLTVNSGCFCNAQLTLSPTASGTYNFTVTGTSGSIIHSIPMSVTVEPPPPDFSISVHPSFIALLPGYSANATLNLASLHGYSGIVSLSIIVYPFVVGTPYPFNVTASLASTTLSIAPGVSATTVVRIATISTTPIADYSVWVTADAAGLVMEHQAVISLQVGPYYTLTPSPVSLSIPAGSTESSSILLTSHANFPIAAQFPVIFLRTPNPYCYPTCPVLPTVSLSPSTVVLPAFSSNKTVLAVSTASNTTRGSYTILVLSGGCRCYPHNMIMKFNVTDFSISSTANSVQLTKGSVGNIRINATGFYGFTGTISLTANISLEMKHAPTLSSMESIGISLVNTAGASSLIISTAHSVDVGTYTILIVASSMSLSRTISIALLVTRVLGISALRPFTPI